MLHTTRHLLSLIRFSHTLFALPFAMLSAFMAWRLNAIDNAADNSADGGGAFTDLVVSIGGFSIPSDIVIGGSIFALRWQELLGILLSMVTARSAAMAFNRLVDRQIDARNPRTAGRHLPAGILSVKQVTIFTVLSSLGFILSTLLFLPNPLPVYLSVPVLAFLCGYSYAKRFTPLAHLWLGAALALSPVAVWIALRGEQVLASPSDLAPALVLAAAVLTWVTGFDIIYACQDFEFDRRAGLRSIPARFGVARALRLAAACHALTVVMLALLPWAYPLFGWPYWVAVGAVLLLLAYEHALVKPDDLDRVNTAFFNVNAVISLGLFAVGTLSLLWGGS